MGEQEDLKNFIEFCDSELGKKVMRIEADFIKTQLSDCNSILDVGCGIGIFEQLLPDFSITGLDSSEIFLNEAKRRNAKQRNKEFVQGDAENLEAVLKEESFDAVFSITTLEFVDDYEAAVRGIWRVLKRGGKIVILILNPHSEYFKEHAKKKGSYFNRIKHKNLNQVRNYCLSLFELERGTRYFLGIRGENVFDTANIRSASLFVIVGRKK